MLLKETIDTVDSFFAELPARRGDRVTVRREALGETVTWVILLDDIECGRFSVSRRGNHWYRQLTATSLRRGSARSWPLGDDIPEIECERHALYGAVMGDLDWDLGGPTGTPKPGLRVVYSKPEYWSEEAAPEAETGIEQHAEPQMPDLYADPIPAEAWRAWWTHETSQLRGVLTVEHLADAMGLLDDSKPRRFLRQDVSKDLWWLCYHLANHVLPLRVTGPEFANKLANRSIGRVYHPYSAWKKKHGIA